MISPAFDEVFNNLPGTGWLTENEAKLLWRVATECSGEILEVGCYHGRSTCLLAQTGRHVYAVDPFGGFDDGDLDGSRAITAFLENTKPYPNVQLFSVPLSDWAIRPKIGLAYLDGDHTAKGTWEQIDVALACNAHTIAIHDVNDSGDGLAIKKIAIQQLGQQFIRVGRLAVWKTSN